MTTENPIFRPKSGQNKMCAEPVPAPNQPALRRAHAVSSKRSQPKQNMKNNTPVNPQVPKSVKCGNVTVPIYRSRCGKSLLYQVPYYPPGGRRHLRSFRNPGKARVFATAVATGEARSLEVLLRMKPAAVHDATLIATQLQPFLDERKITLDKAISEYRAAKDLFSGDLDQAVGEYCAVKKLLQGDDLTKFVTEALEQPWRKLERTLFLTAMELFLEDKAASGRKQSTCDRHKYVLMAVGSALGNPPLRDVTKDQLKRQVHKKNRSLETNRSYRSSLGSFYQWLDENDYLRPDRSSPMAAVESPTTDTPTPAVITVPEARQALSILALHGSPEETLIFALSLFAGFRKSELVQAQMHQIQPRAGITVPSSTAKTRTARKMPLLPVTAAWFGPFTGRKGFVALRTDPMDRITALLKTHGFGWKRNWLRHSYCSYRFAYTGNAKQTAKEAGHSVAVLFRNYDGNATKEEAIDYFQLTPEACGITDWPQRVAAFLKETPEVLVRLTRNRKPKPVPEDDDETGADE